MACRRAVSNRGFSALELAMVMLTIMALSAMVMFVGGRARGKSRMVTCLSNVKQLGTATAMYATDHGGLYPHHGATAIMPYVKNCQVLRCPSAPERAAARPWDYIELPTPPATEAPPPGMPEPGGPPGPPFGLAPGEPTRDQVDYLFIAGLTSDMRPETIIAFEDAPDRHASRTFNYVRIDGAAMRGRADDWPGIPPEYGEVTNEK